MSLYESKNLWSSTSSIEELCINILLCIHIEFSSGEVSSQRVLGCIRDFQLAARGPHMARQTIFVAREAGGSHRLNFCSFTIGWTRKLWSIHPPKENPGYRIPNLCRYVAREVPANLACGPHTRMEVRNPCSILFFSQRIGDDHLIHLRVVITVPSIKY